MGAGGLGGYYGGLLARAGHEVTFIARGVHLEAIRRQGGLTVRAVDGEGFGSAAAADAPAGHPPDLILFTVKSYDTETAAELVRPAVGPETALLSLQNGVDNEETLARRYGADRVLGGLVYILATIQAPGIVQQSAGPRAVTFGEWRGGMTDRGRHPGGGLTEAGGRGLCPGGDDRADAVAHRRDPRRAADMGDVPPDRRGSRGGRPRPGCAFGPGGGGRAPGTRPAGSGGRHLIPALRPQPRQAGGGGG